MTCIYFSYKTNIKQNKKIKKKKIKTIKLNVLIEIVTKVFFSPYFIHISLKLGQTLKKVVFVYCMF